MITLAWDSSGQSQAAALAIDGLVQGESWTPTTKSHSELLLPTLQQLLDAAGIGLHQVDRFALTVGPGSFTGLRIGIATLKAFCRVADRPVAAISTLDALAFPLAASGKKALGCLDARLGQVFAPAADQTSTAIDFEQFAERLRAEPGETWLVGSGALLYRDQLAAIPGVIVPEEEKLHQIQGRALIGVAQKTFEAGRALRGVDITPQYLRASEAENRLGPAAARLA